ncbi:MAG: type I-E CRISPR-associated protein Cse1/CasA [Anaerovoracaceae bacterium]
MGQFNLTDSPWIRVMPLNGSEEIRVSLIELFSNAHKYKCLCGETGFQDFAVLRLLESIVQTVFSRYDAEGEPNQYIRLDDRMRQIGELDEDDLNQDDLAQYTDYLKNIKKDLWQKGRFPDVIIRYLERNKDAFYLQDEKQPFMQVTKADLESLLRNENDSYGLTQKNFESVLSGNVNGKWINRTISENGKTSNRFSWFSPMTYACEDQKNVMKIDELARWLLTYQGYPGASDKINKLIRKNSSLHPSYGWDFMLGGIFLEGENLFETLIFNFIPVHSNENYLLKSQKPVWETGTIKEAQKLIGGGQPDNLAELYTNIARLVYIDPNLDINKSEPVYIGSIKLPALDSSLSLEPMTIWETKKKGGIPHSEPKQFPHDHAMWRNFGIISMKDDDAHHRPEVINEYKKVRDMMDECSGA